MKITLTLLAFSVLLASSSYSTTPIMVEATASMNSEGNQLQVGIVLVNQSEEEITVLTQPDSKILGRAGDGTLTIAAGFGGQTEMLGHLIVPSIYKYDPVPLKPNEATGFIFTMKTEITEMKVGEKIIIQYSIGDDLSGKYGLPSSLLMAEAELIPKLDY